MNNFCIVFSVEKNVDEPNYEKMAVLLAKSIRDTMPNVDIHCGVFTNRVPSQETIKQLIDLDVGMNFNKKFEVEDESVNYFLRNYTKYYFSKLLDKYNYIVYVDIDVIFLKPFIYQLPKNSVLVEEVPDYIIDKEVKYLRGYKGKLYYNWFDVITKDNKFIFDVDYTKQFEKESDILVSKNILKSNLNIIHQNIGAYYPKHKLNDSTLFHYDGFIDSGSFYELETYSRKLYQKYRLYSERILKFNNNNNKEYWKDI